MRSTAPQGPLFCLGSFYIDALQEAIVKYGCPEVLNTDQVSQFTSEAFLNELKLRNIRISMDGKLAQYTAHRWIM